MVKIHLIHLAQMVLEAFVFKHFIPSKATKPLKTQWLNREIRKLRKLYSEERIIKEQDSKTQNMAI